MHSLLTSIRDRRFAPKYVGLAQSLLRQIGDERLRPGDRLGTEVELARKHGVSRVTVRQALALLEKEGFIVRKRARGTFVRMAVDDASRQGLSRGTIVVVCSNEQVCHTDEDFAFATALRAMEKTFTREGFAVQILGVGEDTAADRVRLARLAEREELAGLCAIGVALEHYRESLPPVPVVTTGYFYPPGGAFVGQDVAEACRVCIGHLLEQGHRQIAMICGSWIDPRAFGVFARGYREAFEAAGLPYNRYMLLHAYPEEPLETLVEKILQGPPRPTAAFAHDWRVCRAVLKVAEQQGLRVPEDLSLVAYGQNVLRLPAKVAVTAYVPDGEQVGARAAELLLDLMDGAAEPETVIMVPGRLVVRGSVAPVQAVAE